MPTHPPSSHISCPRHLHWKKIGNCQALNRFQTFKNPPFWASFVHFWSPIDHGPHLRESGFASQKATSLQIPKHCQHRFYGFTIRVFYWVLPSYPVIGPDLTARLWEFGLVGQASLLCNLAGWTEVCQNDMALRILVASSKSIHSRTENGCAWTISQRQDSVSFSSVKKFSGLMSPRQTYKCGKQISDSRKVDSPSVSGDGQWTNCAGISLPLPFAERRAPSRSRWRFPWSAQNESV